VHPRVRGGTAGRSQREIAAEGASPRARGNLAVLVPLQPGLGCIPACAGEPTPWTTNDNWTWVHPRVRGGTFSRTTLA